MVRTYETKLAQCLISDGAIFRVMKPPSVRLVLFDLKPIALSGLGARRICWS